MTNVRYVLVEFNLGDTNEPVDTPETTTRQILQDEVLKGITVRTADATPFELAFSVADDDTILFQAKQMFKRLS